MVCVFRVGFGLFFVGLLLVGELGLWGGNWPSWRGAGGDGVAGGGDFPTEWSRDRNVRWSVGLPERGNSSPVVWGDRVFVSQAEEGGGVRGLMCFGRGDGGLLWHAKVRYVGEEPKHRTNTYCATSPVTDGERVYVSYGSAGFYCYDVFGRELWHRRFGEVRHEWGEGSSPVLYGDLCVFYWGPGEGSFLVGMDRVTGEVVWRVADPLVEAGSDREDGFMGNANGVVGSFCTPMVVEAGGRVELVMAFPESVRGYDPLTGGELWRCGGLNPLVYCSLVRAGDVVVAMGGYFGPMVAVRVGGDGDVTGSHRLWKSGRMPRRLGTGVAKGGLVFVLDQGGFAECIDVGSGESRWRERVRGEGRDTEFWGSAVLAGGFVYGVNQSGDTVVLEAGGEFVVVSVNGLGEKVNTTPAFSDGEIFIRSDEGLWCVADLSGD